MSYLFDELKGKENIKETKDKILLMGLQQAGKTAIKDVVFFGKEPEDVDNYMATIHYERQFIDEEKKSLIIDAGGQESYWNEAVTHFRHLVFSDVKILFWVIDMKRPDLFEESERRFSFTIRQYKKQNPDGQIVVLCHKIDLIPPEDLVPMLDQIKEEFSDKRFEIRYEATSIYYSDSLKTLIFSLMKEVGIDTRRFELITDLAEKVESSEEFQSYVMEHQDDPRIRQLMEYLNPDSQRSLPTFGHTSVKIDLEKYDIIELVLFDKETFSPSVGASSRQKVNIGKSMDYILALQEFKQIIKENHEMLDDTANIFTSSNEEVHGLIINLKTNFLLITSFNEITKERTQALYELIRQFAKESERTDMKQRPQEHLTPPVTQTAQEQTSESATTPTEETIQPPMRVSEPTNDSETESIIEKPPQQHLPKTAEQDIPSNGLVEKTEVIIENEQQIKTGVTPSVELPQTSTNDQPSKPISSPPSTESKIESENITPELEIHYPKVSTSGTSSEEKVQQKHETIEEQTEEKSLDDFFITKLKQERKSYKERQIKILAAKLDKADSEEEITLSKKDLKLLAEYLAKDEEK